MSAKNSSKRNPLVHQLLWKQPDLSTTKYLKKQLELPIKDSFAFLSDTFLIKLLYFQSFLQISYNFGREA